MKKNQFYVDKNINLCYTIVVFNKKQKDTHYMKNTLDKI